MKGVDLTFFFGVTTDIGILWVSNTRQRTKYIVVVAVVYLKMVFLTDSIIRINLKNSSHQYIFTFC